MGSLAACSLMIGLCEQQGAYVHGLRKLISVAQVVRKSDVMAVVNCLTVSSK